MEVVAEGEYDVEGVEVEEGEMNWEGEKVEEVEKEVEEDAVVDEKEVITTSVDSDVEGGCNGGGNGIVDRFSSPKT